MLSKADDYPIHQTSEPIAYAGSDRNFYDRYFFNGFSTDGELYFAAALGVYPQLNIMDAAFSVRIGGRQYNLRASRHLNMERMDTQVGPIRVEVLVPLQRLRIVVDDNAHGVSADVVFEGRIAPIEEPRAIRRNGPRMLMDVTRMTQLGGHTGWVRAGGQEIRFEGRPGDKQVMATRDRSWGVRPIGERDPQAAVPAQELQVHWYWLPAQLEDRVILFYINEDATGYAWNVDMLMAFDDGRIEHLDRAKLALTLEPGTRWPASGTITAEDRSGGVYTIAIDPGPKFFMSGIGYMHPEWNHGVNKGPLTIGYDELRVADAVKYGPPWHHVQAVSKIAMTTPDGTVIPGMGGFESLSIGRHEPLGLTGLFDA